MDSVSLALGVIGVFVPLLPTTPFLLLAAACYLRSLPALYHRLINSRFLGQYLRHYHTGEAMPFRARLVTLGLLWLTVAYSVLRVTHSTPVRVGLLVMAVAVTVHIVSLRSGRRGNR